MKRFLKVLTSDLSALRFTLGVVGLILGFGFFVSSTAGENYDAINQAAAQSIWGAVFFLYGAMSVYSSMYRIEFWTKGLLGIFAIWLWSYIFFSFVVFDVTPARPTEWVLLVLPLSELWMLLERPRKRRARAAVNTDTPPIPPQ